MCQLCENRQVCVQVNIENFSEDEVIACKVHWVPHIRCIVQFKQLLTVLAQVFKVADATVFQHDSSVKFC